jgi:two-component system C4-dicarboxylate transport sensor histidine kinase DctB
MLSILRSSPLLIAVGACGVLLSTLAGGAIATSFEMNRQRTQLAADLGLRRAFLRSEIERHRLLPKTLAGDGRLWQAVDPTFSSTSRATMALELSARFEDLARSDGAVTLYLVDRRGTTVSSSNFRLKESFVGQNYAFRSYFTDSIANGFGELFARGTVSGIPGLYLAHQLQNRAGVVVVKVEFDELERNWRDTGDHAFVTDHQGQVLLTSDPSIRFRHLTTDSVPLLILGSSKPAPISMHRHGTSSFDAMPVVPSSPHGRSAG